jgi:hypothetical protein
VGGGRENGEEFVRRGVGWDGNRRENKVR